MINRREALKRVSLIMGGALSSSAIAGVLQGCSAKREVDWEPKFLSQEQAATVSEIAERILPKTDTPGAKDAGVPEFIDLMLNDIYTEEEQQQFLAGLEQLEKDSESEYGDSFAELQPEQQDELLRKLAAQATEQRNTGSEERPFFSMIKELTMLGFFTSEVGATQFLQYVAVPGSYDGCVPLEEVGKAWAT